MSELPTAPAVPDTAGEFDPLLDYLYKNGTSFVVGRLSELLTDLAKPLAAAAGPLLGLAIGPAAGLVAKAMEEMLDTAFADTAGRIADVHFGIAREAFHDALRETSRAGADRQFLIAETELQTAFGFYTTQAAELQGKLLSPVMLKQKRVSALAKAVQAALSVATINAYAQAPRTAASWAERARRQYDEYEKARLVAARNGRMAAQAAEVGARAGQVAAPVAGVVGAVALFLAGRGNEANLAVKAGFGAIDRLGEVAESASDRRDAHQNRPTEARQERAAFEALHRRLITG